MASDIDIANSALSHLGDSANIADFAEGSTQASLCQRFYPIARDSLLEQHQWNFATRRGLLTAVAVPAGDSMWQYAYVLPNNCLQMIAIMPANASSDYAPVDPASYGYNNSGVIEAQTGYVTQEFVVEIDAVGTLIILTNVPNAFGRWTARVTDPTKFSPLFTDTLGWYLASYLAGPIIKGDVGRQEAKGCLQIANQLMGKATVSDSNQRFVNTKVQTGFIAGRN